MGWLDGSAAKIPYCNTNVPAGVTEGLSSWEPTLAYKWGQRFVPDCASAGTEGITVSYENMGLGVAGDNLTSNPIQLGSMTVWARIKINSNPTVRDSGRSSFELGMKKTMMHEIGHTVALDDAGGGCGSGSSVMNGFCGINEEGGAQPLDPSTCDRDWAQATGSCGEPDPPPTCGEECGGDPDCIECECNGGDWLWVQGDPPGYSCESPILVNLRNNTAQYHLTSSADGVRFDIDADGRTEQISWTAKDTPVAFLAMDRN